MAFHPGATGFHPGAMAYDPRVMGYDPQVMGYDPGVMGVDGGGMGLNTGGMDTGGSLPALRDPPEPTPVRLSLIAPLIGIILNGNRRI